LQLDGEFGNAFDQSKRSLGYRQMKRMISLGGFWCAGSFSAIVGLPEFSWI
jgi:hypothetical protein